MASTGSASGSMTSYWIKFFEDSGIPAGEATNYAITFTDNRITAAMLLDLNKEYLNDMGITVLGDVIAILKHSKTVHAQETVKERALRAANIATPSPPRRSTPASRTVNHYLGSDPDAKPMNEPAKTGPKMSKELAARLGPTPATPATESPTPKMIRLSTKNANDHSSPKIRRVLPEHEGRYKIIMPRGTTERSRRALEQQSTVPRPKSKSSVFGRLGAETPKETGSVTVTGLGNVRNKSVAQDSSSVFSRLGTTLKRPATSTSEDPESEEEQSTPLEYAGVLKSDAVAKAKEKKLLIAKKKKVLLLKQKQLEAARKQTIEQRLGPQKADVSTTAGILSPNARQEQINVKNRLGKTVVTAASSTTTVSSTTPNKAHGIHARLGRQLSEVSSTGTSANSGSSGKAGAGVFQRLGKPVL